MTTAEIDVLLAFADDEHFMGQHHTEWIGIAPFLEEDLAFSSIGQDELGHAALLYELVLELRGQPTGDIEIDELAFRRSDAEYRSSAFTEFVTTDWAEALVRHWIYDTFEAERWGLFAQSTSTATQAVAATALREEAYHVRHANALLDALLTDTHAQARLLDALQALLPLVPSLLSPVDGEVEALASGFVTGSVADLGPPLQAAIAERFGAQFASSAPAAQTSRNERSTHFQPLIGRMREVLDYDPQAVW